MTNSIIALLQFIILFGYIGYVIDKFGIITSISDSTYMFKGKKRFLFTLVMVATAVLNLHHPLGNFGVFASLGLMWTGMTITFKRDRTATPIIHYSGAIMAIVLSYAGLIALHGLYPLLVLPVLAFLLFMHDDNFIWWLEIFSICGILMGYFLI